jgi:hypothetical protein
MICVRRADADLLAIERVRGAYKAPGTSILLIMPTATLRPGAANAAS